MPLDFSPKAEKPVLCSTCNKRPATKICDFPIGRSRCIGHPPRGRRDYVDYAFVETKMSWTETCDKPLCDQCAISMNAEIDFCPSHIKELLAKQKPNKPQK